MITKNIFKSESVLDIDTYVFKLDQNRIKRLVHLEKPGPQMNE